jgi:predicted butyrate kinase (DUF1464 family)
VPRVIGIDPGTVSIDLCGLEDGRVFLDRSLPTADALAVPSPLIDLLRAAAPLDLVAGPSGYGLPLTSIDALTDDELRLMVLAAPGEDGGIGGLGMLLRSLRELDCRVVLTPGVIHLPTVPDHRKVNRVDMGTADKVCAVVLAVADAASRRACGPRDVSLILLELGGAFTAAVAVQHGVIVDGLGGTSGPLGMRGAGALDGEVAFLAGRVSKQMLFEGGVNAIAGVPRPGRETQAGGSAATVDERAATDPDSDLSADLSSCVGWRAYVESAAKAVAALRVSAPAAADVVLSGRVAHRPGVATALAAALRHVTTGEIRTLTGFATASKQAAQGAALLAHGLAGGPEAELIATLGITGARGTVLDHLHVISPAAARRRLGIVER